MVVSGTRGQGEKFYPSLQPTDSGLKRPKRWPNVEKNLGMIEILCINVFGVTEFKNEGKSQQFQMADLKLPTYLIKSYWILK